MTFERFRYDIGFGRICLLTAVPVPPPPTALYAAVPDGSDRTLEFQ